MSAEIFYRDPRSPRDVYGPCTIDQLRDLARAGRLHPADQVSLDGRAWMPATELEPELFPASSADWFLAQPAWKRSATLVGRRLKTVAKAAWKHLKTVGDFYWAQRTELRQLSTEYLTFLQQPGSRREIRVSAHDQNPAIHFDGEQWQAELPDCCVVCGEPADCDWNSEQRNVPDLTWPLLGPVMGILFGLLAWILMWSSAGKWFVPLGGLCGFLVGYWRCRQVLVTIRFRRCREHLSRTRIPRLRTFGKTLIVGIGDRKVWRHFYYGHRDFETPAAAPFHQSTFVPTHGAPGTEEGQPSYPTIPLAGDDEPRTGDPRR